jgi:glycosyltransferase involved in cell wall biosynthesis
LHLAAQIWWERDVLPGMLGRERIDLLFEPGNRGILKPPCPKVSLIHNLAPFDDDFVRREKPYQRLRNRLLRHATLESMKASDGIIFISEFSRRALSNLLDISSKRSAVIYHGRFDEQDNGSDENIAERLGIEQPFLLCVSHIWRYKKIFEMVQAYERALVIKPNLPPLVIAGANYSPEYYNEIQRYVLDTGIGGRIRFLGAVAEKDLPTLYRNSDSFLFPSVLEACPNILIEALSSGCAIGCSDRGVMPEIAGAAALYFNPDNIDEFASKIISLTVDRELNVSLRRNSKLRAQVFSWEKTAWQTLMFFDEVLGRVADISQVRNAPRPEFVEV